MHLKALLTTQQFVGEATLWLDQQQDYIIDQQEKKSISSTKSFHTDVQI